MNKQPNRLKILLIILSLVVFLAGLFYFDDTVEKFNQNKFIVFGGWLATVIGTLLAILLLVFPNHKDPETKQAEQKAKNRADLLRLLDSVEKVWITDVLQNSLHQTVLLELGKESQPNQVVHPLEMQLELPQRENRLLPPTTTIAQVFQQEAGRHLLILGEPGFGKTTTLLQLAQDLLKKAKHDANLPIPVVFTLSGWAQKQQPLPEWMAGQLSAVYQIPKAIGEVWLREHRILPLLDGLDEVPAGQRAACALAINDFAGEAGLTGLAVTCRQQEYEALAAGSKLHLNAAINLQPLRPEQVEKYLAAGGRALTGLRGLLREDAELQELTQSPLLLSIMSLAYHGVSLAEARADNENGGDKRGELFGRYVEKMFNRRKMEPALYSKAQVLEGLVWLAKNMQQRGQTVLLLEYLQPDWLPSPLGYRLLYSSFWFGFGYLFYSSFSIVISMATLSGLFIFAVIIYLSSGDIVPVETVNWSKEKLKRLDGRVFSIALVMMFLIVFFILITNAYFRGANWLSMLPVTLVIWPIISLVYFLAEGLDNKIPEQKVRVNQGIAASFGNTLRYGIPLGLVLGLIFWTGMLGIGRAEMTVRGFAYWFIVSVAGLSIFLGGDEAVKHYILRLLLFLERLTPFNYVRFLDYAARLILLRKAGGGYVFIHRLMLEHFAAKRP